MDKYYDGGAIMRTTNFTTNSAMQRENNFSQDLFSTHRSLGLLFGNIKVWALIWKHRSLGHNYGIRSESSIKTSFFPMNTQANKIIKSISMHTLKIHTVT